MIQFFKMKFFPRILIENQLWKINPIILITIKTKISQNWSWCTWWQMQWINLSTDFILTYPTLDGVDIHAEVCFMYSHRDFEMKTSISVLERQSSPIFIFRSQWKLNDLNEPKLSLFKFQTIEQIQACYRPPQKWSKMN